MPSSLKDRIVVKRYADAYFSMAKDSNSKSKALEDFKNLKTINRENPGFMELLSSPEISFSEKSVIIDKILNEDFAAEFKNFLKFLLEKNRIDKLLDIAEYVRLTYSHENEAEVVLKSSFPLELEAIQAIKNRLENKFKKKINLYLDLDGSLLGGVQVMIGNYVIDGSVRKSLNELKEQLMAVRV